MRTPDAETARAVQAAGAELVTGDLLDRASQDRAAEGARAVFSVQTAPFTGTGFDFDAEVKMGLNLIEAARSAGVRRSPRSCRVRWASHWRRPTRRSSRPRPRGCRTWGSRTRT
ncbi:NmrA family NAD(P)-binding protein [Nonomuraea sp. NPDC049309]|uniref:NmrA family NAD(P)-binding protein n=1 Tax=Nonomuraea sp. NPDC049309 TaxID=3364350 RepID=UPI0037152055